MNDPFSYLGISRDADRSAIKDAFVRTLEKCRDEKSNLEPKEYERRIREARIAYEAASKIAWARSEGDLDDMDGDGGVPLSASEKLARKLIGMNEWKPKAVADNDRHAGPSGMQEEDDSQTSETDGRSWLTAYGAAVCFAVLIAAVAALFLFFVWP